MSDWNMLIWLTQLGLSVVLPLAGMTGLAIWLCSQYQLGRWNRTILRFTEAYWRHF